MIIHARKYIKPTKAAREIAILEQLAVNNTTPQSELGDITCLSGAMINQYLRTMRDAGWVQFVPMNGKKFRYELTAKGEQRRRALFADYSSELVQVYSSLKDTIKKKLDPLLQQKKTRIVLYGASETCEVVLSALCNTPFEVVALVDGDGQKHGKLFHGRIISPPETLELLAFQAIVITTFVHQAQILERITPLAQRKHLEIIPL